MEDLLGKIIQALRAAPHSKLSYAELETKTGLRRSSLSYALREMLRQKMVFGYIEERTKRLTPIYKLASPVHWISTGDEKPDKNVTVLWLKKNGSLVNWGLFNPFKMRNVRYQQRIGDSKITLSNQRTIHQRSDIKRITERTRLIKEKQ